MKYSGDLEKEVWKDVIGLESFYQVSNLGRVRGIKRYKDNSISYELITTRDNKHGYDLVVLAKKGQKRNNSNKRIRLVISVHRIVAESFIPNPKNKTDINHIDGNKKNNASYNLEWCTKSENMQHAIKLGLVKHETFIKDYQIQPIRDLYKLGYTQEHIARVFNVNREVIKNTLNKKNRLYDDKLVFMVCVPSDLSFAWEIELQLENFRKFNYSEITQILVYHQIDSDLKYWKKLQNKFKEVKFFFYSNPKLENLLKIYVPIIRPDCLKEHFLKFPELEKKVIFYCDSDILFTKYLDFIPYLKDEIIYASNITSYNGIDYFDKKIKDVMHHKRTQFEKLDILNSAANIIGINRQVLEQNPIIGGCQYLLKNINSDFWKKIKEDCIKLKVYFNEINSTFFCSEKMAFQSWCSDLWAIWWNLLKRGDKTNCPDDLNFSWATSPIKDWNKNYIYHNAGINGKFLDVEKTIKLFDKADSKFRLNLLTPFDIKNYGNISKEYCNYNYLQEILKINNAVCKVDNLITY